jgi:hypothetical protein
MGPLVDNMTSPYILMNFNCPERNERDCRK